MSQGVLSSGLRLVLWLGLVLGFDALCFLAAAESPLPVEGMIQAVALDPGRPLFVPTHGRVTTTLRFPGAIGAPEGRGFTEEEGKGTGEYLVAWTQGESHVTITPLPGAGALNLNIPFQGATYVFYFYPVESQFQALASLNLSLPARPAGGLESKEGGGGKVDQPKVAATPPRPVSPARLLGLIDRLKLVRALPPGPSLELLAKNLGLELAVGASSPAEWPEGEGLAVRVIQVVRDARLDGLGFGLLLKNTGTKAAAPDVSKIIIRCGERRLVSALADVPAILTPGEEREGFVAAVCPPLFPLKAANEWLVTLPSLP